MQFYKRTPTCTSKGFTLLELLIVMVIVAVSVTIASLALPPSNRNALDQDAAQMAALMDAARSYAAAVQAPVRLEATVGGYQFVGIVRGNWQVLQEELRPRTFLTPGAQLSLVNDGLLLGPEPVGDAVKINIAIAGINDEFRTVYSDGASPFFVQAQ